VPAVDAGHEHAGDLDAARAACASALDEVAEHLEGFRFRKAAGALIDLARFGNRLFDERAPWTLRKTDMPGCELSLHVHIQVLATLSVLLTPFVPGAAGRLRAMLGLAPLDSGPDGRAPGDDRWVLGELPVGHALGEAGILFAKIEDETVADERGRLGARS